jgi:protein-S-isoprenylcysteine O-methyltransferase Ste14
MNSGVSARLSSGTPNIAERRNNDGRTRQTDRQEFIFVEVGQYPASRASFGWDSRQRSAAPCPPVETPRREWLNSGVGWILVEAGVAISVSSVRAASDVDLERPSTLISTGPYAISRNPMYVGWTSLYVGGALITRNTWMVASLPVVAGAIHRDVLREEHRLERAFGEEYLRYRKRVRRYL